MRQLGDSAMDLAREIADDDLPPDFPCVPLGYNSGIFFILAQNGQIQRLTARDLTRNNLVALVSPRDEVLERLWPRVKKDGTVDGFRPEKVADAIMRSATRAGAWEPGVRLRGVGCWADDAGRLVLHCGDVLLRPGEGSSLPGVIDGNVYERRMAMPRPAGGRQDGAIGAELLDLFERWAWSEPELAPQLVLGWLAAAFLSGALTWRPMLWVTGTAGTGKSTLQEIMRNLLGPWLVSSSDASAAGLWQRVGCNAQPVALDEIEADESNERANQVIKLARQASSGGLVLRGGSDHQGAAFTARSAFLFSSIYLPPLRSQDLSRITVLELGKLDPDAPAPRLDAKAAAAMGARLCQRCLDSWAALPEHLDAWRRALTGTGFDKRGADQWGALLALGHLMGHDALPDEDELGRAVHLAMRLAKLDQAVQTQSDPDACLLHLATSLVPQWRAGERSTVGHVALVAKDYEVRTASGLAMGGDAQAAQRALSTVGCRVVLEEKHWWLAVANTHAELGRIYERTHWAGRSGASGVWRQALLRLPFARPAPKPIRFGGYLSRAVLVPIDLLGSKDGDEAGPA